MQAEKDLSTEIDNHAPSLVRKIVENYPNVLPIAGDQRALLARMVLRTITRNPAILAHLSGSLRGRLIKGIFAVKRWLERGRMADSAYERIGRDRVLHGELVSHLVTIDIDERVTELSAKRFVLIVPNNESPNFVLGSQPYFINPSMLGKARKGERKKDAFCGIVIHPRILLALFDDQEADEIITANLEDMQRINGLFVKYSSAVIVVTPMDLDGVWFRPLGLEESDEIQKLTVTG